MPTTTSPLTPATHGLRVAASFNPRFERLLTGEGKQHSIATAEILKAIEKLGLEERAQLWTCFQEAEEIDELVAAIDEGIQPAGEGRVFSLEEIKIQMQS
jgi:hypothetical protein